MVQYLIVQYNFLINSTPTFNQFSLTNINCLLSAKEFDGPNIEFCNELVFLLIVRQHDCIKRKF